MFAAIALRSGGPPARRFHPLAMLASVLALGVAAAAPAHAAAPVSHFVLGNGMEVVVVPDRRVPVVTHDLWFKVGAAEDPADQPGVAHFLEHMMFRGTEKFPGNSFHRFMMSSVGTLANAVTSLDYTRYPQSLPKQKLAELMEREADRMVNLNLRDEDIKLEIGAVLNERRGRESDPSYLFYERRAAAQYPDHPFSRTVLGTPADIKSFDRSRMLAFYRRYYAPNNAILVVAGDVTESEVRQLAEKTYGRLPARPVPKRIVHPLPAKPRTWRVEMEHERVTHPSISYYYATPGVAATPRADASALSVFSHISGAYVIGRLHRRLVTEKRLAISVSASYSLGLQGGELIFTATVRPGVSFADLERGFAAEIATLARGDITEAEADDAKRAFLAGKAYDDDNHRQRATDYGYALVRGLSVADVETGDARIAKVKAADINRLARQILGKSKPVVGVLRPLAPIDAKASAGRPAIVK